MKNLLGLSSLEETRQFYDDLMTGKVSRGLWGKKNRFDPSLIARKESVNRFFVEQVYPYFSAQKNARVLDLGCGPGGFLYTLAPMCGHITGADISKEAIKVCRQTIKQNCLKNADAVDISGSALPFEDGSFDIVVMVDLIHHMSDILTSMVEVKRVLRPGGKLLIFEPNRCNPALFLMCALDRNERRLLMLGTKSVYRKLLRRDYDIERCDYNGLLIGPDSKVALFLANLCSASQWRHIFGFMSPKIFIAAKKR